MKEEAEIEGRKTTDLEGIQALPAAISSADRPAPSTYEQDYLSLNLQPHDLIDLIGQEESTGNVTLNNYDQFLKDRVVEIENPQLIREGYLMSYKLYRLKTKKRNSKSSWDTTVDRRFNDFQYLNHSLIDNYGGYVLPRLPDKNVLASFNLEPKEFQEARLHELEKYIERLLHHPQVRLSSELKWFLFDQALHFSSEKGGFIEQAGAFGGLGNFTASMASLGRTLLTKYIGNKEPKNQFCQDSQEDMELRVFSHEIEDLLQTTKDIKHIINCSHQELMVIREFTSQSQTPALRPERLELLIVEFEDIAQFIESCSEAISRTKQLKQQVDALEEEEAVIAARETDNPRNRELDSVRSKLHRYKVKYERWIKSLKKELASYTSEGKTLMEGFVKRFIDEKNLIYKGVSKGPDIESV